MMMKMQYVLTGFKQDLGFRVFGFTRIGPDRTQTAFVVRAELALALRYRIPLQELPLLCREVLEGQEDGGSARAFTFSEDLMQQHASACDARREASRQKRTPFRRSQPEERTSLGA